MKQIQVIKNVLAVCFLLLVYICAVQSFCSSPLFAAESAPVNETSTQAAVVAPAFGGVADVVPKAIQIRQEMDSAKDLIAALADQSEAQALLEERKKQQQELMSRIDGAGDLTTLSFERLLQLKTRIQAQKNELENDFKRISTQTADLEKMRTDWRKRYEYWKEWRLELKKEGGEFPVEEFASVLKQNEQLRAGIAEISAGKISLQKQFNDLLESNGVLDKRVENALQMLRSTTFKKSTAFFFSPNFYKQFTPELFRNAVAEIKGTDWRARQDFSASWWVVLLQLLVVVLAAYIIKYYARNYRGDKQWNFLLSHPWAGGMFISIVSLSALYSAPGMVLRLYLALLAVFSACILVTGIIEARRHKNLVWLLGAGYLVTLFLQAANLPLPLMRVFLASMSGAILVLLAQYCVLSRRHGEYWLISASMRVGMAIALITLVAQVGGYSTLSARLVDASFKTVFLALLATMVLKLARGGVNFALYHSRVQRLYFFSRFGYAIKAQCNGIIKLVVIAYALLGLGQIWTGSSSIGIMWERVAHYGVKIGELQLDLATLIDVAVVLYCAVVLSWFVRSLLDAGRIGPRYMDPGVRDSIKTLIHYCIILCGVMFALSAAGIGLQNFAVIAGALSIGIGFGLQNIVNNFISGIILLFERPIRKGDTIILDGEWAVVRNIGLRSTAVETFNKAELIVPNSDLIAQKVTNLTHSNSQTRVVMNIGVAYGSDMEQVLGILEEEAGKHANASKDPAPSALFVGFGDSSLDFQLRIWLNSLDHCLSIRSEVGIAIYKRFNAEGIEIPFPQQDLHLRSMAENVVSTWSGRVEVCETQAQATYEPSS